MGWPVARVRVDLEGLVRLDSGVQQKEAVECPVAIVGPIALPRELLSALQTATVDYFYRVDRIPPQKRTE